jgi:hypothetical protein
MANAAQSVGDVITANLIAYSLPDLSAYAAVGVALCHCMTFRLASNGPVQNTHALLAISAVLAFNARRLHRKRELGESASYDGGGEQPVTRADVLFAVGMTPPK